jgi:hypothetical protein
VLESETAGMQELPLQAELAWPTIDGVARDRKVDRGEMNADLMRPPGLEANVEEGMAGQRLDELEVRHRVARRIRVE